MYVIDKNFYPLPAPPVEATPAQLRGRLIELLRDRSSWPLNFEWNFARCNTCALGLAWETICTGLAGPARNYMDPALGLTDKQSSAVFAPTTLLNGVAEGYGVPRILVTPEMVADRLAALHNSLKD